MCKPAEVVRKIYEASLRNQHAVEHQSIELIERQVERLESYPDLSERLRRHIDESKQQAFRLEDLLREIGTRPSSIKDAVRALEGDLQALVYGSASDGVIKTILSNYAFEHYEIAAYKSLLTLADINNHAAALERLSHSLAEEEEMAAWIDEHLPSTTRQFVSRSAEGKTAGI